MSASFSKQKRRQLATLDLAECVLHGIGKAGTKADKARVARIRKQRDEITALMFGGKKHFLDSDSRKKQYARCIKAGTDFIDQAFEQLGEKSNDFIWLNFLCYILQRGLENLPEKCKKLRSVWTGARDSAYTLYLHHDKDASRHGDIDIGMHIGEDMLKKIEGVL